jgi:hypothetical protein
VDIEPRPIVEKRQGELKFYCVALFLFVLLVIVLIPFLQPLFIRGNYCPPVTGGFVKLQPVQYPISYRARNFTAYFINNLGVNITLNSVVLNETGAGHACEVEAPLEGDMIKSRGVFMVSSSNCPPKEKGDEYNMSIIIIYNATMGGITTNHTEKGYINGDAEALDMEEL